MAAAPPGSPATLPPSLMAAKLETSTRVFNDSHWGHTWVRSRSAYEVSTSNRPEQSSQRYSYSGIGLDSKLAGYARLLESWPGLVGRGESAALLVEDSLALVPMLGHADRVVDVGSGGVMPGIPLAIAGRGLSVTLVESDRAKAAFLVSAVAQLGLDGVTVVAERAEVAGHDPGLRERFDVAVSRALAPMPVLAELCLPLVRVGGRVLAMKTASAAEVASAAPALARLGGGEPQILPAPTALRRNGEVVVVIKRSATPSGLPRRPGIPAKRPLGT